MKRLINKLKEKPKLYKCLKILGIVGICLSLIFNAIILGSVIAYSHGTNNDAKQHQNVATTPLYHDAKPKKSFSVNQYDFYSLTDLSNNDAFYNFNAFFQRQTNVNPYGVSQNYTYEYNTSGNLYLCRSENLTLSNITGTALFANIIKVRITAQPKVQTQSSPTRNYFTKFYIDFVSSDNGNFLELMYNLIENGSLNATRTWYCEGIYWLAEGGTEVSDYPSTLTAVANYQNDSMLRILFPYNLSGSDLVNNAYLSGKSAGYEEGYHNGYVEGQLAQGGINNNIFSLLAQGFGSVASVLNVQLIPGMPIWVMLFAPAIVAVVVVVVRMIKG